MLSLVTLAFLLAQVQPPSAAQETITVTAHPPGALGGTAEDVRVVSRSTLQITAAPTVDDALRQVPGFTLFRRTGSRAANPTSQTVSLRGIGASGTSRALVLDDGVPMNDPFGGWVYWGRIVPASLERVEVMRGGASDLYGSGAMGGVIELVRRRRDSLDLGTSFGINGARGTSLFAAVDRGEWSSSVSGDLFRTDGYVLVPLSQRGVVDVPATSRHTAFDATFRRGLAFVRASTYSESRGNGTPLQINDTHLTQVAAGLDTPVAIRGYYLRQRYHQTFSAVAANRATERLTIDQRVPSHAAGGSLDWRPILSPSLLAFFGADLSSVSGSSNEVNGSAVTHAGGTQRIAGAHAMLLWQKETLSVTSGVRVDHWQGETAWSPRVTALYELPRGLAFTASAYSAFRAPTLNELFRDFRVGNVLTLANRNLGPERLTGLEAGARVGGFRLTVFDMRIRDAISNVTLSVTPSLITRQRQNEGSSRSQGIEAEWSGTMGPTTLTAGLLLADTTLSTGKQTPQVPRQAATLQLAHRAGAATFGLQTRWSSLQFDDDLNTFPLRSAFVTDLFASHPVARGLEMTFALENAFDARVEASATPVTTLGQPRAFRLGLRYSH
jgi:outer membrane cobalamin receptor